MSLESLASSKDSGPANAASPPSKSKWIDRLSRWFPIFLLLAFLALGWLLFGDRIVPARQVEIITVVTLKADVSAQSNDASTSANTGQTPTDSFAADPIFQASGWIEAAPLPTRATTLIDGVVEQVLVLEGERVEQGQLIATMIADDAEIAQLETQARLAEAQAEVKRESAGIRRFEAELKTHALLVKASKMRLNELKDDAERYDSAGQQAFSEREVEHAKLRVKTREAEIAALQGKAEELAASLEAQQLMLETAKQRVSVAEANLRRAKLDLSRTEIRSPIDGIIQHLFVAPGQKRRVSSDEPESATIAIIYQPESLQARIDVPLEEAAQLTVGNPVLIRCNLLPNREFRGRVTRIAGMADIQRNTLQAKVAIIDPDPRLRPEMLCRAAFLPGNEAPSKAQFQDAGRVMIYLPPEALINRQGESAEVWTLGEIDQTAQKRSVRLGQKRDEYIAILEGLKPGDPVILTPPADLEAGERVKAINPQ